jgi:hypothetical protein
MADTLLVHSRCEVDDNDTAEIGALWSDSSDDDDDDAHDRVGVAHCHEPLPQSDRYRASTLQSRTIQQRTAPDFVEFTSKYRAKQPVKITDIASQWRAYQHWHDVEYLIDKVQHSLSLVHTTLTRTHDQHTATFSW